MSMSYLLLFKPTSTFEYGYNSFINSESVEIQEISKNISNSCNYYEYENESNEEIKNLLIGMYNTCIYEHTTKWIDENIEYDTQKSKMTRTSQFFKYDLNMFTHKKDYVNLILSGEVDSVCTDFAILECSIIRTLDLPCTTKLRYEFYNDKFTGHVNVQGTILNKSIICEPTAGRCYYL